jgi:hypothetical protein
MKEENEKNLGYSTLGIGHGRANLGTGHANILELWCFLASIFWHSRPSLSTGRANLLVKGVQKFSFSSNHTWTIT